MPLITVALVKLSLMGAAEVTRTAKAATTAIPSFAQPALTIKFRQLKLVSLRIKIF
jgi:hypothetical protein